MSLYDSLFGSKVNSRMMVLAYNVCFCWLKDIELAGFSTGLWRAKTASDRQRQ